MIHGTKLTKNSPIENFPEPEYAFISTAQHIGAPASPVVQVGDKVKKGTLIATASAPVSANVYSSIAGEVTEIKPIVNGLGRKITYIVIKNDRSGEEELLPPVKDLSPETIIERVRLAGIVGLGGAGFPTDIKLSPKTQIDTLVVNGAECEPYLTCDDRLMREQTDIIYKGIKLAMIALKVENVVMGIEKNKPDALAALSAYPDIKLFPLKKQYPMGSEKQLIYVTTGRKIPVGKMPFDVGCCVLNVKTLIAIHNAVEENKPLTETVMTVSGKGVATPKNLRVPLGTPYTEILDFCGGKSLDTVKIIAGGPMMGKATANLNMYASKTDSGILCLKRSETCLEQPSNCINCGICAKNCPMRLMPMYIESFALSGNFKEAERYGAMNCIECGLCAYNCPAKRALVQSITLAKAKLREMKNGNK